MKRLIGAGLMVVVLCAALGGCYLPGDPASEEPEAHFTWTLGSDKRTVTFDGSISSYMNDASALWCWDFGDGVEGLGETITHTYANPGPYPVTLIVINSTGVQDEITKYIVIVNHSPIPSFWPTLPELVQTDSWVVQFDARRSSDPDGEIVRGEWCFDDRTPKVSGPWTQEMREIDHTFVRPGWYEVCLTVWDDEDKSASTTHWIRIRP